MKKLLVLVLSAVLVLGFVTVSMAATIATSGEIDLDYFTKNWNGDAAYTSTEVGVYNAITISDSAEAHLNFWYESNSKDLQTYNLLDDAYMVYKFGANSLLVGKTRYWQMQGPTDALSEYFRGLYGGGDIFEPAVSVVGTFKVADSLSVAAGYFYNTLHSTAGDTNFTDDGINSTFVKAFYSAGNLSANLSYFQESPKSSKPNANIEADVAYKLGNYSVWVAGYSIDESTVWASNGVAGNSDNFGLVGATASIGNLWVSVDYQVSAPDTIKDNAYGYKLNYYFGNNTSLNYQNVSNTRDWCDMSRLRLIIKF